MRKIIFGFIFVFAFSLSISAQNNQAREVDEFGDLCCENLLAHGDSIYNELQHNTDSKIYLLFYEGKHSIVAYNKKTKKYERQSVNPKVGEGLNRTRIMALYLTKGRKIPKNKVIVVNGGYRENYEVEIWLVPKVAEPPKLTPTLTNKDIKFRKGKPRVPNCLKTYSCI